MPRRGRPPKTIEQRELEGNAGKRPIPQIAHEIPRGEIDRPTIVSGEARKMWDFLVEKLGDEGLGVLSQLDPFSMTTVCRSWELYIQAVRATRRAVREAKGTSIITETGARKKLPEIDAERGAFADLLKAIELMGLDPRDRTKLLTQWADQNRVRIKAIGGGKDSEPPQDETEMGKILSLGR